MGRAWETDGVASLISLCDDVLCREPADQVRRVRDRLAAPLRVAVAGRLNAGKSTLVNALLGQRVAPVDNRECTRIVTWYEYGAQDRVRVEHEDGSQRLLTLDEHQQVPTDLRTDPASVARVVVMLSNATLRDLTIIDTPGLDTASTDLAGATRHTLGLGASYGEPDVTVYVMTQLRAADRTRLRQLLHGGSPMTDFVVLSKVDRLGSDEPWPAAERVAGAAAHELRGVAWDVQPVIGLLAESAAAGRITERDARAIHKLLSVEPSAMARLLVAERTFLDSDDDRLGPVRDRQRLIDRFAMYGLRRVVLGERLRGTARDYSVWAHEHSRFDAVRSVVSGLFRSHSHVLKMMRARNELLRMTFDGSVSPASGRLLRDGIGLVDTLPGGHQLRELELLAKVRREAIPVGLPDLEDEMRRVLTPGTVARRLGQAEQTTSAELVRTARGGIARWRAAQLDSRHPLSVRRAAEVVERTYMGLMRKVEQA